MAQLITQVNTFANERCELKIAKIQILATYSNNPNTNVHQVNGLLVVR